MPSKRNSKVHAGLGPEGCRGSWGHLTVTERGAVFACSDSWAAPGVFPMFQITHVSTWTVTPRVTVASWSPRCSALTRALWSSVDTAELPGLVKAAWFPLVQSLEPAHHTPHGPDREPLVRDHTSRWWRSNPFPVPPDLLALRCRCLAEGMGSVECCSPAWQGTLPSSGCTRMGVYVCTCMHACEAQVDPCEAGAAPAADSATVCVPEAPRLMHGVAD